MKKLQYVIYVVMILIIIGLVAYDYYPDQTLDQNTITRAALLFVGTILSIIKAATRSKKDVLNKKAFYMKGFGDFIGNAFSHSPQLEKAFYEAVKELHKK